MGGGGGKIGAAERFGESFGNDCCEGSGDATPKCLEEKSGDMVVAALTGVL